LNAQLINTNANKFILLFVAMKSIFLNNPKLYIILKSFFI